MIAYVSAALDDWFDLIAMQDPAWNWALTLFTWAVAACLLLGVVLIVLAITNAISRRLQRRRTAVRIEEVREEIEAMLRDESRRRHLDNVVQIGARR